jgi:hypothetical protein
LVFYFGQYVLAFTLEILSISSSALGALIFFVFLLPFGPHKLIGMLFSAARGAWREQE